MIMEYVQALLLIFAAEMGDKTQILAMMFATKYKTRKVLLGIAIGSFLNHGLAVMFGVLLGNVIQVYVLQMIAGAAFIGFALWTLMTGEEDEDEETHLSKNKSAVVIVAMAFFVGELGDKTQLTAITLALDAVFPIAILFGTVSGMLVTSSLGIFVGSKIGDRLPETLIKVVSSGIFLIFGVLKLLASTPEVWVNVYTVTLFTVVVGLTASILFRTTWLAHRAGRLTPYSKAVRRLYDYAHSLEITADDICRGVKHCGQCDKEACAVGFIRHLAKEIQTNNYDHDHEAMVAKIHYHKGKFSKAKLENVVKMNQAYLDGISAEDQGYKEVTLMQEIVKLMLDQEAD